MNDFDICLTLAIFTNVMLVVTKAEVRFCTFGCDVLKIVCFLFFTGVTVTILVKGSMTWM